MSTQAFILMLIGIVVSLYALVALMAYLRLRGTRIVVCPETREPAAVRVDAGHAALSAVREKADIELTSCSRWKGVPQCDQACTQQIAAAPAETRASAILRNWFAGKPCAICRRPVPPVHHAEQHPGLLNVATPAYEILSWEEIPDDEHLPAMLQSHLPVCSHCVLAETFRRKFPELVTDRPDHGRNQPNVH